MSRAIPVTFRGRYFPSKVEVCRHYDLKSKRLSYYESRGLTFEQAVEALIESKKAKDSKKSLLSLDNKQYATMVEASNDLGVSYTSLKKELLTKESSLEEVVATLRKREIDKERSLWGRKFKDLVGVAKFYNLRFNILEYHLRMSKSLEEAVFYLITKEPITYNGKDYPSFTSLCNEYEIFQGIVEKRLRTGWSFDDALTRPVERNKKVPVKYNFRGKNYTSDVALTEDYGYNPLLIRRTKKKYGMGTIEALEYLENFISRYSGNRPKMLSSIPSIIYGDKWYEKSPDFYSEVGVNIKAIYYVMEYYKLSSPYEALKHMSLSTSEQWVDNQTNLPITQSKIERKYGVPLYRALKQGYVSKRVARDFPKCTFNHELYFATPRIDFKNDELK